MVDTQRLKKELSRFTAETHITSVSSSEPCTVEEYRNLVSAVEKLFKALIRELENQ